MVESVSESVGCGDLLFLVLKIDIQADAFAFEHKVNGFLGLVEFEVPHFSANA